MASRLGCVSPRDVAGNVKFGDMKGYKTDLNNRVIFSSEMKLAELIEADYSLLSILLRLDMQLPFGDVSVAELCRKYDVSAELFLMICQLYSSAEYVVDVERLGANDLKFLVSYLRASHRFYLGEFLPSIAKGFDGVLEQCDAKQQAVVGRFYRGYCDEVKAHLEYEEQHLFPYVEKLSAGELCGDSFQVGEVMDEHADICDKIDDIKSILIKYLPESCTIQQRYALLCDVFRMSDDLAKHTLIEIKILAPLARAVERRLNDAQE